MSLRINSEAPNFTAKTTQGTIGFHDWIGNGWAILFSHPKDFTPVCTTELGYMAGLMPEFQKTQLQDHRAECRPGRRPCALGQGH
jgi:alkyl hydroperoxide reductase subunit AhpC